MYCNQCGANNQDGARFCAACGQPIVAAQPRADAPEPEIVAPAERKARKKEPIPKAEDRPRKRGRGWRRWGIAMLVAAVLGGVAGYFGPGLAGKYDARFPFLGMWPAQATHLALDYVVRYQPDFAEAEVSVSPILLEGEPVYVVDFVLENPPRGLRLLVDRGLSQVWVYEYFEGY